MHETRSGKGWRQWAVFVVVATVLLALVLAARPLLTRHSLFGGESVSAGQSFTVGLTASPSSLDIRTEEGKPIEQALMGNVYETLLTRNEKNEVKAGLAESWKTSKDGLTLTLTLREELRFANGHKLDAADAAWSLQQAISNGYVGSNTLTALASVTNPDSTTLVLTLSRPDARLPLALASRAGIVYDQQSEGLDYASKTAGSGPFLAQSLNAGNTLNLVRNTNYWGDAPTADRVKLRYFSDPAALLEALSAGELDLAVPDPTTDVTEFKKSQEFTVSEGVTNAAMTLVYNHDADSDFSVRPLREAMRQGLNKNTLVTARHDAAEALGGPLNPLEAGYEDLTGLYPYDLEAVNKKVAYFNYLRVYLSKATLVTPSAYQDLAQTIAEQLALTGAKVTVEVLDGQALADRLASRQFTMTLQIDDGDRTADQYASADASLSHYATTPEARAAWDTAMAATTAKDYATAMAQYARQVSTEAASDWLYARKSVVIRAKTVSGAPINMADFRLPLAKLRKE